MSIPTGPHYVYRLYDDEGTCLYVGCSTQPAQRMVSHSRKAWGERIDYSRTIIEKLPGFFAGRDRESILIAECQPAFNEVGTAAYKPGARKAPRLLIAGDSPTVKFKGRDLVHWSYSLSSSGRIYAACGAGFRSVPEVISIGATVTCSRCNARFEPRAAEPAA